jgi:hypothetical protein
MAVSSKDLGKLVAVYGPAPAFLQRAVFLTVLSFLFFLGTMFVFYLRQGFVYFILASAFLVLYLVSLVSVIAQRKNVLVVYEHGIGFKKASARWNEILAVSDDGLVQLTRERSMIIPKSLNDFGGVIGHIRANQP